MQANKVPWPTIVDSSREFEAACGLGNEISLENIYQVKYLTPEGKLHYGNPGDLAAVVEKALDGASWTISASDVPQPLKHAWRAMEFGNHQAGAKDVMKGLDSSDSDTLAMAKKLESVAMKEFKSQANAAAKLAREGDFWPAYKDMARVQSTYGDYNLPKKFLGMISTLESKTEVKVQVKASKQLKKAAELTRSRAKSKAAIGRRRLKELIEEYPDTEAAARARKFLGLKDETPFR